ncbi:dihydrofolate reductase [Lactiplantibacillus garii]|uniref:Dihydrofolate reductase n=1 Tax=Lactiplantibacillus garii TaxID=2306423 RepID=A0A3R8QS83_9LACO|nr:dihydrofolate reductase [Lactiplantibacillus garii]RRK10975.1 dihydrofolate reductase [Lactiplantibacillus garii]
MIALIWAEDQNGLIGANGQLPWHLPADMHRFKTLTTNHDVVMGRKTFDGFKRPLPHRTNWVLSHRDLTLPVGVKQLRHLDELWALNAERPNELIFVIGGAGVFEAVLPSADRLYRTKIKHAFDGGDTWMPTVDYEQWQLSRHVDGMVDAKNRYPFSFDDFTRR